MLNRFACVKFAFYFCMCEICIFASYCIDLLILLYWNLRFCTSKLCSMLACWPRLAYLPSHPAELFKCMKAWSLEADDNSRLFGQVSYGCFFLKISTWESLQKDDPLSRIRRWENTACFSSAESLIHDSLCAKRV